MPPPSFVKAVIKNLVTSKTVEMDGVVDTDLKSLDLESKEYGFNLYDGEYAIESIKGVNEEVYFDLITQMDVNADTAMYTNTNQGTQVADLAFPQNKAHILNKHNPKFGIKFVSADRVALKVYLMSSGQTVGMEVPCEQKNSILMCEPDRTQLAENNLYTLAYLDVSGIIQQQNDITITTISDSAKIYEIVSITKQNDVPCNATLISSIKIKVNLPIDLNFTLFTFKSSDGSKYQVFNCSPINNSTIYFDCPITLGVGKYWLTSFFSMKGNVFDLSTLTEDNLLGVLSNTTTSPLSTTQISGQRIILNEETTFKLILAKESVKIPTFTIGLDKNNTKEVFCSRVGSEVTLTCYPQLKHMNETKCDK